MNSTKPVPCTACASTSISVSEDAEVGTCRDCAATFPLPRSSSLEETFGEVIHSYSRAEAIADGVLVDLTKWAGPEGMLSGWKCPVAATAALWNKIEDIPERTRGTQTARGRAHDVLWMAFLAAKRAPEGESLVPFRVIMPTAGSRERTLELVAHAGPGDAAELVVTLGFSEDF